MAFETLTTGRLSELVATTALLANGWEVAEPVCPEVFDLVVKSPRNGKWYQAQVKTVKQRTDRAGELVIPARKNNGTVYSKADADLIVGVHGQDVYLIANRECGEYWSGANGDTSRWERLRADGTTRGSTKTSEAEAV